ncbi:hypothetical protein RH831_10675 [Halodesulfurarchaeum sp. HSR-GB]|uniref:hypothetical protein n=1 Tax=Halodesulfurarchaeum sp. HSR-GB TaxID=3074077 RepID=UPI002855F050|nr:hypothetical protein [Halodesulfurarchaeum sp. HSR-GB]MDR5657641.1 hypothetical protein [Halodesulfurarchaeum sp. HSR-GB]
MNEAEEDDRLRFFGFRTANLDDYISVELYVNERTTDFGSGSGHMVSRELIDDSVTAAIVEAENSTVILREQGVDNGLEMRVDYVDNRHRRN